MSKTTPLFPKGLDLNELNAFFSYGLFGHMGICLTAIEPNRLTAKLPEEACTLDYSGVIHGGAISILAESLGGIASGLILRETGGGGAGLQLNVSHFNQTAVGALTGICEAVHVGTRTHVWAIEVSDSRDTSIAAARLTVALF